jgi:hypothetical protein
MATLAHLVKNFSAYIGTVKYPSNNQVVIYRVAEFLQTLIKDMIVLVGVQRKLSKPFPGVQFQDGGGSRDRLLRFAISSS